MASIGADGDWIDVSVAIHNDMATWPDDPRVWVKRTASIEDGAPANSSHVSMSAHTGTHLDAPYHFIEDGEAIDRMPLSVSLGRAHVVQVDGLDPIEPDALEDLPEDAERVLFRTENSMRCWQVDEFVEDYVYLSEATAQALVDRGVKLVGIDYLSVGGLRDNIEAVHQTLLSGGAWILEGLDLAGVEPGVYELACLPLKLQGADGAPARAALKPL